METEVTQVVEITIKRKAKNIRPYYLEKDGTLAEVPVTKRMTLPQPQRIFWMTAIEYRDTIKGTGSKVASLIAAHEKSIELLKELYASTIAEQCTPI